MSSVRSASTRREVVLNTKYLIGGLVLILCVAPICALVAMHLFMYVRPARTTDIMALVGFVLFFALGAFAVGQGIAICIPRYRQAAVQRYIALDIETGAW